MKTRCGSVGVAMITLALTAGCSAAGRDELFGSPPGPSEGTGPGGTGSSVEAGMPASPSGPAAAMPSPDTTTGGAAMPDAESVTTDSPSPAGAPPVQQIPRDPPIPEQPAPVDEEPATEPEPVPPPTCELGEFGPLEKLSVLGVSGSLWGPALSADDTVLFFTAGDGAEHLFVASRSPASGAQFLAANPVVELTSSGSEGTPFVSASGLRIYFYSTRAGSSGGSRDLWVAERSAPSATFGAPRPLLELNSTSGEFLPRLSADELNIVFTSQRPEGKGKTDIWQAQRLSADAPFGDPVNVAELNTEVDDTGASLSPDGLTVLFSSTRAGGQGRLDIWRATRTSVDQPFGPAEVMPQLSSPGEDLDLSLSSDGRELLLSSDRDGAPELWRSVRACQ